MSSKKNISIKIEAETNHAQTKIDELSKKVNSFQKQIKKNSLVKLAGSIAPVTQAVTGLAGGISAAYSAIKSFADIADTQIKAEKSLEKAAKNNPYLNRDSVNALKDFSGRFFVHSLFY